MGSTGSCLHELIIQSLVLTQLLTLKGARVKTATDQGYQYVAPWTAGMIIYQSKSSSSSHNDTHFQEKVPMLKPFLKSF